MTAAQLQTTPADALRQRMRQLEVALAEAEERLLDFLSVSSDWIWETDEHLRFILFSGGIEEATGVAPDFFIGKTREDLASDRASPKLIRNLMDMRLRKPFRDFIYEMESPRERRYLKVSGKPVYGGDGRFRGYRGTGSDVTAEIEADRRAETTYRRFAEAIESVPASLLLCDSEDRILICNSATRTFFPHVNHLLIPGTPFEDLVRGQALSGYIPEAVADIEGWVEERMSRHRAAESMITRQYTDERWTQIIERRTSDGGIIGVRVDVTELKERERELKDQALRIADYTKELERSNAELEQFAYVASHDLQEPLRMVASYCQLLQRRYKGKLDEDADEFIGFAVEGASRMQRLINDLLSYSRVGRRGRNFQLFTISEAVEAALANLQGAIVDSGARVEIGGLPAITGDRTLLAQLFQNLIGNGIKFRREEPVVIRISATLQEEMWRFTVEDNGIGIEPEYLERVFLIFQRLHERSKYPGTGIGLAIARKVVEHHGGRIWIESTPGQGSRFHFTLPAAAPSEEP